MDFRSTTSRLAAASSMNGVPILPVSNERHSSTSSAARSASLNMSSLVNGNNISMPLSLPIPLIGQHQQQQQQQHHKRQRVEASVAPPPGMTFPYRLDVDLSAFPPTAHATSLQSQHSPHQQRPSQGSLSGLPFPQSGMGINMGMQNDNFSSQTPFEFPSSRRSMSYPSGQSSNGGSFGSGGGGGGGVSGMFGSRPGTQTANMLMDLLNSTAGNDASSFEWPASPQGGGGGQLDGTFSQHFFARAGVLTFRVDRDKRHNQ